MMLLTSQGRSVVHTSHCQHFVAQDFSDQSPLVRPWHVESTSHAEGLKSPSSWALPMTFRSWKMVMSWFVPGISHFGTHDFFGEWNSERRPDREIATHWDCLIFDSLQSVIHPTDHQKAGFFRAVQIHQATVSFFLGIEKISSIIW
jgi:hypothetical protein